MARATSACLTGTSASACTSDSATERAGTISATMPCSDSARAVPGPIAATLAPAKARASAGVVPWPRRSNSALTAFGLVKQTRSYCVRSGGGPGSGCVRITGACTTFAPSSWSARAKPLACARARVTATVWPLSGRGDSHSSAPASPATGPTTVIEGARSCSRRAISAMLCSVPVTVRWSGSVPRSTIATGSEAGRPAAISDSAIWGSWRTPM